MCRRERALLELGVGVNKAKSDGRTPLVVAADNSHEVIVRVLIEAGADANKANDIGVTPLLVAAEKGHEGVVLALIEAGADGRALRHISEHTRPN